MSWNIVQFLKDAGEKIFGHAQTDAEKAVAVKAHLEKQGLATSGINIAVHGGEVEMTGTAENQELAEKAALAVGNVAGIEAVKNLVTVTTPTAAPVARTYTVQKGDNLSKIAQSMYGSANKYQAIFEANKPMLTHPDKIYPGQVLRIPELASGSDKAA